MRRLIGVLTLACLAFGGPLSSSSFGETRADKKNAKQDAKVDKRDLKAGRAELKRLRADANSARKSGDKARLARDEAAIQKLDVHMKTDCQDLGADNAKAKAAKKDRKKGTV